MNMNEATHRRGPARADSSGRLNRAGGATLMALAALVAGCTPFLNNTDNFVRNQRADANQQLRTAEQPRPARDISTVRYSNDVWLGNRSFRRNFGEELPSRFQSITLIAAEPLELQEIAAEITEITGLPVKIEEGASEGGAEEGGPSPAGGAGVGTGMGGETSMAISHQGSLRSLLDKVASRFNYSWEYHDGTLYFLEYVTRTFALRTLPTSTTYGATVSSGGTGDTSSAQDLGFDAEISIWAEIESALETLVPSGQGSYALSPSTGTITVTGSPWTLRGVERYIRRQNEVLNRQVVISVQVLSVRSTRRDQFGLDLDVVFQDINERFDFNLAGPPVTLDTPGNLGSFGAGILSPTDNPALGQWNGTRSIIQALSTRNEVSLVTSASVTTLNNQAVPVQVVRRQNYVASTATTVTDGISSTEVSTDTLSTGFIVNLIPRILSRGEIILQYSLSLSELLALETFNAGDTTLQLPDVNSREFVQQIRIGSGDTLVLAGLEQSSDRYNERGIGRPDFFAAGGQREGDRSDEIIVIMVTPVMLR